ncbi:type I-E CRISPR-associated protein Cse1/CasA [Geotalea uraniireducens]|uniref:CRISPR-associated protein, Cse1 family n=1 Tax=Geotalea uraniireducens (strain Rf4) TaxID=351605 RepID=A5GBL8_GEOUR|nr:type I-E CRISPR-associated protein Cse1/CasA [Geotalea uraniireducens]ABQ25035.1 CRISPR-associated protein, Cse1 family [Geotalea uraniireducens Rf4]
MNVAFDPWIPVVTITGGRELASLCSVLTEGDKFADLAVRPHERVSLMRLFLCVTHAALKGPKDYDEWCEVPKRLPVAAQKYLTEWKDSFELFHKERPWLQVAGLKGVEKEGSDSGKTSPLSLLDFELSTGNNSTLHDHGGQLIVRQIEPERVVLNLLTFQNFSSGGGSPVAQWMTTKTLQVGNPDAPCLSQSMAHCLFRGASLAETIQLNLPTFETARRLYNSFATHKKDKEKQEWERVEITVVEMGKPVWEFFPESPDSQSDSVINATKTYIGRLVPISRWVLLFNESDQMYCCNGFKYDTFKDGFPSEPTASVQLVTKRDKNGAESVDRKVVKIEPSKALWRELSALLVKRSAFGLGGPLAMENAPHDSEFDFHVCAMTRDQASMDIALESVFHVTPAFQFNFPVYQAEIVRAEGISRRLGWTVEVYRKEVDGDWANRVERAKEKWVLKAKLQSIATIHYWTTVEKNLALLMTHIESIGTDDAIPTREAWRKMLFATACDAYSVACGQETPRQMRAFAKGWQKLTTKKDEPETDNKETKEEDV